MENWFITCWMHFGEKCEQILQFENNYKEKKYTPDCLNGSTGQEYFILLIFYSIFNYLTIKKSPTMCRRFSANFFIANQLLPILPLELYVLLDALRLLLHLPQFLFLLQLQLFRKDYHLLYRSIHPYNPVRQ